MEDHVGHCDQANKPSKTKVLFVSAPPSSYAETITFDDRNLQPINLVNNRFLPVEVKFSYLDTTLNIKCRDNEDVVFRNKKAGNAFGALRKCLFSNPIIFVDAKRAIYEGLVLFIVLYGAESWYLTEKLSSMLGIFPNCCVRSMCRVAVTKCYNFTIINEELLTRLNLREIDDYISKR